MSTPTTDREFRREQSEINVLYLQDKLTREQWIAEINALRERYGLPPIKRS